MPGERHVVFGCNGPVGRGLVEQLAAQGHEVVGVCRSGDAKAPRGVRIEAGDARDRDTAARLARDADVVHAAIGIPYPQWTDHFMPIVDGLLHGARAARARLVWTDNLYAYGPRNEPLHEDMKLSSYGKKPALRSRMVERMLEEHEAGRVPVAFVRASDFVGPRARNAILGDYTFQRALDGKRPQFLGDPDQPHAYTYIPDLVRTQLAVAADESAFGKAWHVPNPPTRTTREIVADLATRLDRPLEIQVLPDFVRTVMGWFDPTMREFGELMYQWKRPFLVDDTRVRERFGIVSTGWDAILDETLAWFRRPD